MRDTVTSCTWLALWRYAPAFRLLSCCLELNSDSLASILDIPLLEDMQQKLLQLIPAFPVLHRLQSE